MTSYALKLVAELITQAGNDPTCELDTDEEVSGGLVLKNLGPYTDKVVKIGPAEVDTAVAIADAVSVIVFSDQPVSMRLTGGETLMANGQLWVVHAFDETAEVLSATSLLFTGNGTNEATIRIWVIEKP